MAETGTRELITVQIGHYANFVGTHFWNMQESYLDLPPAELEASGFDMDALYMAGRDHTGRETYTPRALIVDLKGSLRSLKVENELFAPSTSSTGAGVGIGAAPAEPLDATAHSLWGGAVAQHTAEPHRQNQFLRDLGNVDAPVDLDAQSYDLERDVSVWSDFNKPIYHPRTIYQIQEFAHGDAAVPFDDYQVGCDLGGTDLITDELLDARLRALLEGCDRPQGLQFFTDIDSGFGGLSASLLESFTADNPKTPIFVMGFGTQDRPDTQARALRRYRTMGKSVAKILEHATTYVPLSTSAFQLDDLGWSRHLRFKRDLKYHTSALQALAIEAAMRPCSLRTDNLTLFNLSSILTPYNSSIASLSACLPLATNAGVNVRQLIQDASPLKRNSYLLNMMTRMNHGRLLGHRRLTQMAVFRGLADKANVCMDECKYRVRDEALDDLLGGNWYTPATISYNLGAPVPRRAPFPSLFRESVHYNGTVNEFATSAAQPSKLPLLAAFATSTDIVVPLADLRNRMSLHQNSNIVRERQLDERDAEANAAAMEKLGEVIAEFEEIKTLSH